MKWKFILGLVISVVFVYLSVQGIQFNQIWESLKGINFLYMFLSIFCIPALVIVRAYRWKLMLKPIKDISVQSLFSSTIIGFMANNILPFRVGEFVRTYSLSKKENISKSSILATQIVERFYDMISIIIIAGVVLYFVELPEWFKKAGYSITSVSIAGLIITILIIKFQSKAVKIFNFISRWFPEHLRIRLTEIFEHVLDGLNTMKNYRNYFLIVITSFFVWIISAAQIAILYKAFSFSALPVYSSVIVLVMTIFVIALPQSPGFVGGFHFACKEGLLIFGIAPGAALGFAIIYHAVNYLTITLMGLYYFARENLKFSELRS
ncbi:lysylphosphatidylglycerol synthase transmembrane domain-containing protein [candidate division KSB1 bacterium]